MTTIQKIEKSIIINALKERVWDVMLLDKFTRIWYTTFSEGSHAETDWTLGSKAIFTDNGNFGLIAKIVHNEPYHVVSLEYTGILKNGVEDYETPDAMKGCFETYTLTEKDGATLLSIELDIEAEYFDMMSAAWEKALIKVKELAE